MTGKRYNGIVTLGATYVTPAGVEGIPVAFSMAGIVVKFEGANYAFTRVVPRRDFATYTPKDK